MYKLFEIVYNDGDWGGLFNFFYIAQNEEEVKQNSNHYKEYVKWQKQNGGDLYIFEDSIFPTLENMKDFEISFAKKE